MKKLLIATLALTLAACQNAPVAFSPRPFAFELNRMAPLSLNVAEIRVVENYQPPLRAPNVEQDFPVAPATAVRKWANSRLAAHGTTGVLEVVIDDASVKETRLKKTEGVKGMFTDDQDARYDAKLAITFRAYTGTQALAAASGNVNVTRSRTINERATVNEREAIYHQMASEMMLNFDSEATSRLRHYFTRFLQQ
jgi:hypothetical protein